MYKEVMISCVYIIFALILGAIIGASIMYALFDCTECEKTLLTCRNDLNISQLEVARWQEISANYYNDLMSCKEQVNNLTIECNNNTSNITMNTTHYSFNCGNIPDTIDYQKMSGYRCYWDARELDGYGDFYSPAEACLSKVGHWWISCRCCDQMSGDVYSPEYLTEIFGKVGFKR